MNIENLILSLVTYAENKKLITSDERVFALNRILECLRIDEWSGEAVASDMVIDDILDGICDYAAEKGIITGTNESRDLFDTKVMGVSDCISARNNRKIQFRL